MKKHALTASLIALVFAAVAAAQAGNDIWKGTINGTWDASTLNWTRDSVANQAYVEGDAVTFDDSATTKTVTSGGTVLPSSVTVNSTAAYTILANIGGTGTILTKSGAGTLTLSGNNTFTGDITVNGGNLTLSTTASGNGGSGKIIFNASGTLTPAAGYSGGTIAVNSGATTVTIPSVNLTFTSATGSGTIQYGNSGATTLTIGDASAFTGTLQSLIGYAGGQKVQFTKLTDAVGSGNLVFGGSSSDTGQNGYISLYGNAGPLTLNNRHIEILQRPGGNHGVNQSILENNNSSTVNKWVINTSLLYHQNYLRTFTLGGSNSGDNEFAGLISNGDNGGTLALTKANTGKWILSGTNTYTGATTIIAGTLEISGAGVLGGGAYAGSIANSSTFRYNSTATQTLSGAISGTGVLIKSNTGTLTLSGANSYSGTTTVAAGTLILSGNSTCTGATTVTNGLLVGVVGGSCSNSAVTVTNTPGNTVVLGVSVTNSTMQWTCASLAFKTNGVGLQLKFNFEVKPGTTLAPLNITGNLSFAGAPLVVVSPSFLSPGTYPLVTVGGTVPSEVPALSGPSGVLAWSGPGNKTLSLTVFAKGSVITVR